MNNKPRNLEEGYERMGKYSDLLRQTDTEEEVKASLAPYYSATKKLFNDVELDEQEQSLFEKPSSKNVIYDPVQKIFEKNSLPLYLIEIIREIFDNQAKGDISKAQLSALEDILTGRIYIDFRSYKTIFAWFYFNNLKSRYDISLAVKLSSKSYHSYMINRLTNSSDWKKMNLN